ncbi:class I SAM-dependent methyltransferase [Albidovulum sp.]|jgi:trans-aconitate methyltransferase|uniref:class I SAM-dependent methyltransferase n=1 Tax=Albidovulum sp. TaxID=1872424 RepID=UPI00305EBB75
MTPDDGFFALHRDLPREGPGQAEDVHWALYAAAVPEDARIADLACGPGADTRTLAKARPKARIEAVDRVAHFVEAARAATAPWAGRVTVRVGDMAQVSDPYDLIWCAGGLYFLGVTEGLRLWRKALAPGGHVAFSEPCLPPRPSDAARAFWADYPAVTGIGGIRERVAAAGYRVLGERMVIGAAWRDYYEPMARRVALLRPDAGPALAAVLDSAEAEIARWRAAPDDIAYALMVVAPE